MTTLLLISMLLASLVVIAALYWHQFQDENEPVETLEDKRISPLLRGINYLLSDEPDRALQEMVQVARLRSEAADVYMALGEMFRSQGEIGRAVRIHQNILARPDVPDALHLQAHIALAKDFQQGGLLDRSLKHYAKVLDMQSDHAEALEASLRIREQSHEWLEAEELLSRLERIHHGEQHLHRAYLLAEMAAEAVNANQQDQALTYARRSIELNDACAHAYLVLIQVFLQQGDEASAQAQLKDFQMYASEHVPLSLPILLEYQNFYKEISYHILLQFWQEGKDEELALAWIEAIAKVEGAKAAQQLKYTLGFEPSSLRASLRLTSLDEKNDEPLVRQTVAWRQKMKRFYCTQCGVKVVALRWQCPQCHTWSSMHTIRGDEDA
ncbi:MAG: heat-shock protein [Mariprofundaceae bacterium]